MVGIRNSLAHDLPQVLGSSGQWIHFAGRLALAMRDNDLELAEGTFNEALYARRGPLGLRAELKDNEPTLRVVRSRSGFDALFAGHPAP